MEEHKIPGSLARIIFSSVEEQIGKNGLNMFLKQAGLEQYIDNPPPDDNSPTIPMSKFKKAIGLVVDLFGEKAAHPLLLRWGRLTFEYALVNNPSLFGLAGIVTKFMSEKGKIRFILKRVLKESENLYDVPHILTEDDDNFCIEIKNCFYCGDLTSENCICWPPVGFWKGMMEWISDQEHEVREIECMAQGADSCKFIISKKPVAK
jgi:predicted hydrocarbon binding protein